MSKTTELRVTLYHNPNCSKSRGAHELLTDITAKQGLSLNVIEYLDTPPTQEELIELLGKLPNSPPELVRNDKNFRTLGLKADDYLSQEQVVDLLIAHPELMQRPVALYQNKALIGRPPEDLQALFT